MAARSFDLGNNGNNLDRRDGPCNVPDAAAESIGSEIDSAVDAAGEGAGDAVAEVMKSADGVIDAIGEGTSAAGGIKQVLEDAGELIDVFLSF